jgi:prepilin-type N-terminal cleavage/methylation domain
MYFRIMGKLNARRNNLLEDGEKGFTLIELLVVVIIIGILAAIAIPIYIGVQNNAKDSAVKSDVSNAKTAVVAYYTDKGSMPSDLSALSTYGYTAPGSTDGNYGTAPVLTVATGSSGAFCIAAVSVTGTTIAASDTTGVAKGTCSSAGAFVVAP